MSDIYKVTFPTGTFYHRETPDEIIEILERARAERTRIRIWYGDVKTGRAWGDSEQGRLGRSGGPVKCPIILNNRRSIGGGALLDHCIVKVEHSNKRRGGAIWIHQSFNTSPSPVKY